MFALSKYATQPIEEVRAFTQRYREFADTLTGKVASKEPVDATFTITFVLPDDVESSFDEALRAFNDNR